MDWVYFIRDHEGSVFSPRLQKSLKPSWAIKAANDSSTLLGWIAETDERISSAYVPRTRTAATAYQR